MTKLNYVRGKKVRFSLRECGFAIRMIHFRYKNHKGLQPLRAFMISITNQITN